MLLLRQPPAPAEPGEAGQQWQLPGQHAAMANRLLPDEDERELEKNPFV